jgi:hypothetical protein
MVISHRGQSVDETAIICARPILALRKMTPKTKENRLWMCHGYSRKAATAPPKKRSTLKPAIEKSVPEKSGFVGLKEYQRIFTRFFVYPSHQMFAINRGKSLPATQALFLALSLRKAPPQKGLTIKS